MDLTVNAPAISMHARCGQKTATSNGIMCVPGTVAVHMPMNATEFSAVGLRITTTGNSSNAMRVSGSAFKLHGNTLWQKDCVLVDGFESSATLLLSNARDGHMANTTVRWSCSAFDLDTSERVIFEGNHIECNVTGAVPHGNSISGYGGRQGRPLNRWWSIMRNSFTRPACAPDAPTGQCGGTNWAQRETLTTDAGYGWAVGYHSQQGKSTAGQATIQMKWVA